MLKLGIEPKTFALLARRSNQLSYSSTVCFVNHPHLTDGTPRQRSASFSMEASFPFQIDPCNPVESDTPDSLGHQWVYSEKDNRIIAARDNERMHVNGGISI